MDGTGFMMHFIFLAVQESNVEYVLIIYSQIKSQIKHKCNWVSDFGIDHR